MYEGFRYFVSEHVDFRRIDLLVVCRVFWGWQCCGCERSRNGYVDNFGCVVVCFAGYVGIVVWGFWVGGRAACVGH